ncbi:MAG TPA: CoA transferase [Alphaproteobacteria bacterium]|nr:CoA transferase [Alphaproteobacteria bacterium]
MAGVPQALDGLKVVEVGGYAAGPWIGKVLANYGATVVHVEAWDRPDGFRLQYPPYPKGKKGINRSGCFSYFNDSKYAVTIDVKKPGGIELSRRLADWADILIENMRPGVVERIGLGYKDIKVTNPDIIYMSTCNMGQTGPRAATGGFGSQLSALAGFCGLTGLKDGSPQLLYGPYIDFVAALVGTPLILGAIDRRNRTGQGAFVDVSQYECGATFLSGAIHDYCVNGRIAERDANADPVAAPHNAYPCRKSRPTGDEWLVLSCWDDAEFARLAQVIGQPGLAKDARFATMAARRQNREALDALIGGWTKGQTADEAVNALQAAKVHSYPVNTIADLFSDPQIAHRRNWRVRKHAEIGDQSYYYPGIDLDEMPGDVTAPAPCIGEHNLLVFKDFLGMTDDEYKQLKDAGVI